MKKKVATMMSDDLSKIISVYILVDGTVFFKNKEIFAKVDPYFYNDTWGFLITNPEVANYLTGKPLETLFVANDAASLIEKEVEIFKAEFYK